MMTKTLLNLMLTTSLLTIMVTSPASGLPPRSVLQSDHVWVPDLRGIPLGRYGETAAVFSVGSGSSKMPDKEREETKEDLERSDKLKRRVAKPTFRCGDPDAAIQLFDRDNFDQGEEEEVLRLTMESPR